MEEISAVLEDLVAEVVRNEDVASVLDGVIQKVELAQKVLKRKPKKYSEECDAVWGYLSDGCYPRGSSRQEQKQLRKIAKNYEIERGKLYFKQGEVLLEVVSSDQLAESLIAFYHGSQHRNVEKTKELLAKKYYWRTLERDLYNFIARCFGCRKDIYTWEEAQYDCWECDAVFLRKTQMSAHWNHFHKPKTAKRRPLWDLETIKLNKAKEWRKSAWYITADDDLKVCDDCGEGYELRPRLYKHLFLHKEWNKYPLDKSLHNDANELKERKCDQCQKIFFSLSLLYLHKFEHHLGAWKLNPHRLQNKIKITISRINHRSQIARQIYSNQIEPPIAHSNSFLLLKNKFAAILNTGVSGELFTDEKPPFRCPSCSNEFQYQWELTAHRMLSHLNWKLRQVMEQLVQLEKVERHKGSLAKVREFKVLIKEMMKRAEVAQKKPKRPDSMSMFMDFNKPRFEEDGVEIVDDKMNGIHRKNLLAKKHSFATSGIKESLVFKVPKIPSQQLRYQRKLIGTNMPKFIRNKEHEKITAEEKIDLQNQLKKKMLRNPPITREMVTQEIMRMRSIAKNVNNPLQAVLPNTFSQSKKILKPMIRKPVPAQKLPPPPPQNRKWLQDKARYQEELREKLNKLQRKDDNNRPSGRKIVQKKLKRTISIELSHQKAKISKTTLDNSREDAVTPPLS